MNLLQRALIEKAGHEHGFEVVLSAAGDAIRLGSARHRAQACITTRPEGFSLIVSSPIAGRLSEELARSYPAVARVDDAFIAASMDVLARLLRRAAALAQALPMQAAVHFEEQVQDELSKFPADLIKGTEVERLVRQRVGQQAFRQAMLEYWGNACAVTGIVLPEVLRASHAKPWAECVSDAERLDVFNGFLLSANLDALFDRFLITFSEEGALIVSSTITAPVRKLLGLSKPLRLRWLTREHLPYLQFHRVRFKASE